MTHRYSSEVVVTVRTETNRSNDDHTTKTIKFDWLALGEALTAFAVLPPPIERIRRAEEDHIQELDELLHHLAALAHKQAQLREQLNQLRTTTPIADNPHGITQLDLDEQLARRDEIRRQDNSADDDDTPPPLAL
jgi:hypothetical protein